MTELDDPFRKIYDAHFDAMLRALRRLGVHEADLEDVTHELFVAVHRNLGNYDRERPLRAWLYGFAYRLASDYRQLARHRSRVPSNHLLDPADPNPGADERLDAARLLAKFETALAELQEDQRVAFVLHDEEGLTAPDIAEILHISVNTVYTRIRLAREELRRKLGGSTGLKDRVRKRVLLSLGLALGATATANDAEAAPPARPHGRPPWKFFESVRGVASATFVAGAMVGAGAYAAWHPQVARPLMSETKALPPPSAAPTAPALPAASDPNAGLPTPLATLAPSSPATAAPALTNVIEGPDQSLASERALVDRARSALARGDSSNALEALKLHQTRFPRGRLTEERELIAIQALTRSGDQAGAAARAQAFRVRFPNSVFLPAVDRLVPP